MKPGRGGHKAFMWDLSTTTLRDAWAPRKARMENLREQQGSRVAFLVAQTFLEDSPHILRAEDIFIPSARGDSERAQCCMAWLVHQAVPMWMHQSTIRIKHEREIDGVIDELKDHSWNPSRAAEVAEILQHLQWITASNIVHRRSMHKAQQLGIRAIYQGALQWDSELAPGMALSCALLLTSAIPPNQPEPLGMLLEATQSSALLLLDKILEEVDAAATTPDGDFG